MKVTNFTRRALAYRREARDYRKAGWERCPPPKSMVDGKFFGARITDAEISADGMSVWVKVRSNGVAPNIFDFILNK